MDHPASCCGDFLIFNTSFSCSAFLKEYKNEDVAVGAWMLGLNSEHVDDRNFCCPFNTGILLTTSFFVVRYQFSAALVLCNNQESEGKCRRLYWQLIFFNLNMVVVILPNSKEIHGVYKEAHLAKIIVTINCS